MTITRRDFLNGSALAIAAGLTPAVQIAAEPSRYPPALTGLRGQHPRLLRGGACAGARRPALCRRRRANHRALRSGRGRRRIERPVSGVVLPPRAADRPRPHPRQPRRLRRPRQAQRVHHRRSADHRLRRQPVAAVAQFAVRTGRQKSAARARRRHRRFETAFERTLYPRSACRAACSSRARRSARDALVAGEPARSRRRRDRAAAEQCAAARGIRRRFSDVRRRARRNCWSSTPARAIRSPGKRTPEKLALLNRTSYRDYLTKVCGCSEEVANCFQGRTLGFFGLGCDAVPAAERANSVIRASPASSWHATAMRRGASPTSTTSPTATPRWRGSWCGRSFRPSRRAHHGRRGRGGVRLQPARPAGARCPRPARLDLRRRANRRRGVRVGYVRAASRTGRGAARGARLLSHGGAAHHARDAAAAARGACKERQDADRLHQRAGPQLARVHRAEGQQHLCPDVVPPPGVARLPGEPRRLSPSERSRRADRAAPCPCPGRAEPGPRCARPVSHRPAQALRDDIRRFRGSHPRRPRPHAGPGRLFQRRDIAAITVNRWPHGYSYVANSLYDPDDYEETVLAAARARCGNVAIANTDSGGDAWVHYAIEQAERAVGELLG